MLIRFSTVLHGESSKRLATPRNTKDKITYNQPHRPNRQTPQTKHKTLPKGQPGRRIAPINTPAVHASAQQQPTISTHTRQGHHEIFSQRSLLRSPGAIQASWLRRRAEPQNTIDTTRLSGDTQRPPPAWGGPSSGVADGQPRAHGVLLSKGRGGVGWLGGDEQEEGGRMSEQVAGATRKERVTSVENKPQWSRPG